MREYNAVIEAFDSTPSFSYEEGTARPRIGYQYRSFESFWSIIKSDSFWATDARFSNDTQEQRFGMDILAHQLSEESKTPLGLNEDYIVCFCAEDDKLSQWRGYAAEGGVSIGFDFNGAVPFHIPLADGSLEPTMPSSAYRKVFVQSGRVCYIEPRKEGEGEEYYTNCYTQISNYAGQKERDGSVPKEFRDELKKCAPFIKHAGFKEENEWRLVFRNEDRSLSPCVRYRNPDADGIRRPYVVVRPGDPEFNYKGCVVRLCLSDAVTPELLKRLRAELNTVTVDSCHAASGPCDKTDAFCFGCTRRCCEKRFFTGPCRYQTGDGAKYRLGVHKNENSIIISQGWDQEKVFEAVHACVEKYLEEQRLAGTELKIPVWCEGHLPVRSLTIGPCTHQREMMEAIQHYCNHVYWLRSVEIQSSKIPFRRST